MEVTRILAEIDAQIAKLQQARALLSSPDDLGSPNTKKAVGRPRKASAAAKPAGGTGKTRVLSPEARKRIADAQKRRWAERRKEA